MATGSVSERHWTISTEGRATALLLHLRQRTYVLPWALFLFAEGTDDELRAVFHTHVLTIQGAGLTALLSDLAHHTVVQISEPDRTAKFAQQAGPCITSVSIAENER